MTGELVKKYKALYEDPENCEPLVQVFFPVEMPYSVAQTLDNPAFMLENQLREIEAHRQVGDDTIPMLRADFGTAQLPAMFGCPMHIMQDSPPCCGGAVLHQASDAYALEKPPMTAGWMPKVDAFHQYFLEHLPADTVIRHPDVQGPFNTAHLLRGNDILFDFFDDPEAVRVLLDKVADFMIDWIRYVKRDISDDPLWFYDSGGLWRGGARMCNCSLQFVSPDLYRDYIMQADERFLQGVGMGRIHYCGSYGEVLPDIFRLKGLTNLEMDLQYHDIMQVCEMAPREVSLFFCDWSNDPGNGPWLERLLGGEVPKKRNIVIGAKAESIEEARRVYDRIKTALA